MEETISIRECRPGVVRFACQMEKILRKNDYKGHWYGCSIEYLFGKLAEETGELGKALFVDELPLCQAMKEATDVSNIGMFIYDVLLMEDISHKFPEGTFDDPMRKRMLELIKPSGIAEEVDD